MRAFTFEAGIATDHVRASGQPHLQRLFPSITLLAPRGSCLVLSILLIDPTISFISAAGLDEEHLGLVLQAWAVGIVKEPKDLLQLEQFAIYTIDSTLDTVREECHYARVHDAVCR